MSEDIASYEEKKFQQLYQLSNPYVFVKDIAWNSLHEETQIQIEVPEPERIGTDKKRSSSTSERGVREHFYYMLLSS